MLNILIGTAKQTAISFSGFRCSCIVAIIYQRYKKMRSKSTKTARGLLFLLYTAPNQQLPSITPSLNSQAQLPFPTVSLLFIK
jgi:hypothetical protein